METTRGALGLNIPIQTQQSSPMVEMSTEAITVWRNRLPMADTGATANQVYHVLSDCNKVDMTPNIRFQILELLRTPVQYICQSLRKHYFNSNQALDDTKLTIVKLAQTLQLEMANGYKIIIEALQKKPGGEENKKLISESILRILHYFSHVLLRSYHLYSEAPKDLWREFYILYLYAERNRLFANDELLVAFKQILIMAITDPYKYRQSDQDAIFNACPNFAKEVSLTEGKNEVNPGLFLFALNEDCPPFPPSSPKVKVESLQNCRNIDVKKLGEYLKSMVKIMEPNELSARMKYSHDPAYTIPLSVLKELIQEWTEVPKRKVERIPKKANIKVCVGLTALHYYLSGEKHFATSDTAENPSALPSLSIQEEGMPTVDQKSSEPLEVISTTKPLESQAKSTTGLLTYDTEQIDETDEGLSLIWKNNAYPPLQAGEVIGLENVSSNEKVGWLVGVISWLKHINDNELRLGVRILSRKAEVASAQIIKEGVAAGYFLRCLILDNGILTPTLPFKTGSQIQIVYTGNKACEEVELLKIRSASGSYKLFDYKVKETGSTPTMKQEEKKEEQISLKKDDKAPFDSIWSNL